MYREADLITCLYGLAGWRQNANPDFETLPPSLVETDTGLYFQDAHPLVQIEYLDQALKNYDLWPYPTYTTAAAYAIGDKARYTADGKVYEALAVIASAPATLNPVNWVEVKNFSQRLESLTRSSINKVANAVFTQKKLNGVTKSIFENVQLFGGVGDLMSKEVKQGRFVGLQITVKDARDITTVIRRIGTQFSLPNTTPPLDLYLWHSSQETPIQVMPLTLPNTNSFYWTNDVNINLRYSGPEFAPGGVFYLGYYEDDLNGQAINKNYNWGAVPCGTCNNDLNLYNSWSSFISIIPFYVPSSYLIGILPGDPGGAKLWSIGATQYNYSNNYGLNLDISTHCDVTDFLCRESQLFTDAIIKQVASDALTEIAYSTRNNTIAKETRDLAMFALSDRDNNEGIATKLTKAIEALSFDVSDLNEVCLPCNNKNGVTWGAF